MKRSESILMVGVTAVLAVVLGVSIVFGGPADAGESDPGANPAAGGGTDPLSGPLSRKGPGGAKGSKSGEAVDPLDLFNELVGGAPSSEGGGIEVPDGSAEGDPASGEESETELVAIPLRTVSTLGPNRVDEVGSGRRYRVVTVVRGDTVSELIERWCPGTDPMEVAALNETRDLERSLKVGQEVYMPWVDDELLLAAHEQRQLRGTTPRAVPATGPASVPTTVPASGSTGAGRTVGDASLGGRTSRERPGVVNLPVAGGSVAEDYTVGDGESLWKIAEKRVGASQAKAYIDRILAINPGISDASRVRAKQKILLPPVR